MSISRRLHLRWQFPNTLQQRTQHSWAGPPVGVATGTCLRRAIYIVVISGEWQIEASDGTTRRFSPNNVLLAEDTGGKGHRSQVVSKEASLALLVELVE